MSGEAQHGTADLSLKAADLQLSSSSTQISATAADPVHAGASHCPNKIMGTRMSETE